VAVAKVSLEQGLTASTNAAKPISAKFEIEDGKLQLSIYTAKGDAVFGGRGRPQHGEGRQDRSHHKAGKTFRPGQKTQNTKRWPRRSSRFHGALAKVLKANAGFRAVSIFPALRDGHPRAAEIALTKGR